MRGKSQPGAGSGSELELVEGLLKKAEGRVRTRREGWRISEGWDRRSRKNRVRIGEDTRLKIAG